MASLTQIANQICSIAGKEFDHVTIERVKDAIKNMRAELIRRDVERNGISTEYKQSIIAELIKVDKNKIGCDEETIGTYSCIILRTENKVPKPINLKNPSPFVSVTSLSGKPFSYTDLNDQLYLNSIPLVRGVTGYSYINGYLYITNYEGVKVRIESIFANPEDAAAFCDTECYSDDMEFPISEHMISSIKRQILVDEFKFYLPDSEITIDDSTPIQAKK